MKVLAVGAHPDDIEIFLFGSLAAWRAMGAELALAVATDGAAGGVQDPAALRLARRAEAERAAALLSAKPSFLDFPDGKLMHDAPLIEALRGLIGRERPDLVVTHAPNCYHADHRALSAALAQATGFGVPLLYADTLNGTGFTPTHWVDVTAHFALKCEAILCHESQDPARFLPAVTRLAGFRAGECNGGPEARAEAFRFEPRFPFADIRALLPPPPAVRAVLFRGAAQTPPTSPF
ncbi:MAG: PIG-L deacetylase family protein [Phaeovulum sp.]|uniref:PIG-L deacetylase family protein n=1 Tax=Phaeovulum sp. TaxID=2934796 RepID=UPI00272F96E8|nr:PIG-L deacetylase family protein [Phaeovulum sp.]MDP2061947.1 PIG-L deacetylase family protein [Phaeovulum sp.]MDP3862048.1 PIG-L deacetylase family protein [Phaeovulum sp.]